MLFDNDVPDKDERMHLLDRGIGRDMGRNLAFDGTTQRKEKADVTGMTVGGAWERNQSVRSFAATTIPFLIVGGIGNGSIIAEGAGAIRGLSVLSSTVASIVRVYSGRNNSGQLLAVVAVGIDGSAQLVMGDFGVNYDTLFIEGSAVGAILSGAAWVASIE